MVLVLEEHSLYTTKYFGFQITNIEAGEAFETKCRDRTLTISSAIPFRVLEARLFENIPLRIYCVSHPPGNTKSSFAGPLSPTPFI
jgi:hypothetical protein